MQTAAPYRQSVFLTILFGGKKMRVIFMGTPDFAVGTLEEIIRAGYEVVLAVSQPDKAVGRSRELKAPPVKRCALEHGIPVYQPKRVREQECIEYLRGYEPDIIIVAAFGQIITKELLDMPKYGCINVHASLLPRYRGASPIQWAVINGDPVTGVTIMRMDEGIDTGDMILREEVALSPDETGGSLFERLSGVGAKLCVKAMQAIASGTAVYTPQGETGVTHTGKIHKELGCIDWNRPAVELERLVRGLDPWPGTSARLGDKTLKLWKTRVIPSERLADPGCIVRVGKESLSVQTADGLLELLEVQPEGKKRMSAASFLNGYAVEEGTFFKRG